MDKILIRGLTVSACHGVHGYEKTTPQKFIFDCDLYKDLTLAAQTDELENTVNYSAVCNAVAGLAKGNTFDLIEKLAYEAAYKILESFAVERADVTVYKPEAPVKHPFENVGVSMSAEWTTCFLSLGSSVGDKKNFLDTAVKKLEKTRGIRVEKVSSYIKTEPYGGVAQNEFLNCAVKIKTFLNPQRLLLEINRIEAECGRVRAVRWDDRTLDIDIIFFGDKIINDENLTVPHREYFKRDFVLVPLKEIAPDFVCPLKKRRISEL
ncbi:MAG: 2-amino-4-hydroxy-6-hydroxymethyldihydropteridine diphosphokinase [Clostridia bacterium]|nr:2-amino-4-hydroxy-6-hydroxymethyldihydropteridine diphosphokinase [Clostridia bacterium]